MGRPTVWPGYRCVFNRILGGLLGSIMVMLGLSSLLHLPHHVVDMGATLSVEQIHAWVKWVLTHIHPIHMLICITVWVGFR